MLKRPLQAALVVFLLSFFVLVHFLALYNRLAADDFAAIIEVHKTGGIFAATWYSYLAWAGRWMAAFLTRFFASNSGDSGSLLLFTWVTFLYFVSSVCFFTAAIFERASMVHFSNRIPRADALLVGAFFAHLIYFVTPSTAESLHWVCGAACYGWGVSHSLALLGFVIWPGGLWMGVPAFLMGAFAAGSNESLAVLLLFLFGGYLAYLVLIEKYNLAKLDKKVLLAFAGIALSFVIVAAAPGNRHRADAIHHETTLWLSLLATSTATFKYLGQYLVTYRIWLFSGFVFSFFLALQIASPAKKKWPTFREGILFFSFIYLVNWVQIFPSMHINGTFQPTRGLITPSVVNFFWTVSAGFLAGKFAKELLSSKRLAFITLGLSWTIALLLLGLSGYRLSLVNRMIPGASAYAAGYDVRRDFLLTQKAIGTQTEVFVDSLPGQDYFMQAPWDLPHVKEAMQLPYSVSYKAGARTQ